MFCYIGIHETDRIYYFPKQEKFIEKYQRELKEIERMRQEEEKEI